MGFKKYGDTSVALVVITPALIDVASSLADRESLVAEILALVD